MRARLLAANLLLLPVFLGLTVWGLDRAFANYQLDAQRESMRLQQVLLAKVANWDGESWRFEALDEPALNLLDSGVYAFALTGDGRLDWHSPSAEQVGDISEPRAALAQLLDARDLSRVAVGEHLFYECELDAPYFCYAVGVAWGSAGPESVFLFVEEQAAVIAARESYRATLLVLSIVFCALLLLLQVWVARWGLLPLSRITRDIHRMERGELDRLQDAVPAELEPLTDSVNQLLASERRRRERVRNTMDRLAHVLKTPLMLLRNSRDEDEAFRQLVQEQADRMLGIVEGELARARLDGRAPDILGESVAVRPVLERIAGAYQRLPRVGRDEPLVVDTGGIAADAAFAGEERDLQDLFGSILENSLKYCRQRIEVSACLEVIDGADWLSIAVADDGDGVPAGLEKEILRRGARADTASVGQGLGLSIAVEIASAYGGSLHADRSALGGALFVVRLPGLRL
jgi:two-component system sensor histidine kinase PhoQ